MSSLTTRRALSATTTSADHSSPDSIPLHKSASTPSSSTSDTSSPTDSTPEPDWWSDRYSIFLLIALYAAQGLPMGLTFGSVPFLLKERGSSYAQLAQFSFASLPYTLKLFIAPIVDSFYSPSFGRRKSWIVPVQLAIGCTSLFFAPSIDQWVSDRNVAQLLPTFFLLMSLAATQDIAVDGWALTMLRKENIQFASTCQSLGLSFGYFATFTIFLAFSNDEFCNAYVRPLLVFSSTSGAILDLASTLRWVGIFYIFLTVYVAFAKREAADPSDSKKSDARSVDTDTNGKPTHSHRKTMLESISSTYADMFVAVRLPAVKQLLLCLLLAKLGMSAYDNVSPLKMLEQGFSKEKMASIAVFQTPFILIGTVLTGRLVVRMSAIDVYLIGWCLRFVLSLMGPVCVAIVKQQGGTVTQLVYGLVLTISIGYSLASECLMFIGMGAFFLNITASSVHVAGSYLTLLNTASNMGGIWHKAGILWLVDKLTIREACDLNEEALQLGQVCDVMYDGFYVISALLIPMAMLSGLYLFKTLGRLRKLPDSAWRAAR